MSEVNQNTDIVVNNDQKVTVKNTATDTNIEDIESRIAKLAEQKAQLLAQKMTQEAVKGLKAKNSEVLGELKKVKARPTLTDEEYANYIQIKERIQRDELLALMAQGKSQEALAIATRKTRAQADAALMAEREEKARISAELAAIRSESESAKISAAISQAAASSVKQNYIGLVEKLVKEQVKVIDGHTRVVDSEGNVRVGSKGQPLTVVELIEAMRPEYADLFHTPTGGGSQGSTQTSKSTTTTTLANMPLEVVGNMTMEEYRVWRASRGLK